MRQTASVITRLLLGMVYAATLMLDAAEPLAVIVNPQSGVTQLTREEVTNLFLGRQKRLGSFPAQPVDQVQPQEVLSRFYRLLVNKNTAEIGAYWARLYFSGQAQPPKKMESAREVIDYVATNKGALGFVEKNKVEGRVKVAFILGEK